MRRLFPACVALSISLVSVVLVAQERPDQQILWKIRQEGQTNSQIMRTLHMLTDVHGPRLTVVGPAGRIRATNNTRTHRLVELPAARPEHAGTSWLLAAPPAALLLLAAFGRGVGRKRALTAPGTIDG